MASKIHPALGLALACDVRTVGEMASGGSGSRISTDVAVLRSLNWLRALTKYSVRLRLCLSTWHSTQIRGLMFWLSRYVLRGARVPDDARRQQQDKHQPSSSKDPFQSGQLAHMRSKAPSGGMKEMVRSRSKEARRTHWWNFMSSRSTAFCRPVRPWASNSTLSFTPHLHSGCGREGCGNTGHVRRSGGARP